MKKKGANLVVLHSVANSLLNYTLKKRSGGQAPKAIRVKGRLYMSKKYVDVYYEPRKAGIFVAEISIVFSVNGEVNNMTPVPCSIVSSNSRKAYVKGLSLRCPSDQAPSLLGMWHYGWYRRDEDGAFVAVLYTNKQESDNECDVRPHPNALPLVTWKKSPLKAAGRTLKTVNKK